jgi:hypothetical protein
MHHDQESVCHVGAETAGYEPQELRKSHVRHICSSIMKWKVASLKEQRFVIKTKDHPKQLGTVSSK